MSDSLLFTVAFLAVWRATHMIVEEEGPFSVFTWIRDHMDPHQKTWVGRGINCIWCVSWWGGLVASLWLWFFGWLDITLIPLWWFGLSGGGVAIEIVTDRLMRRR